MDVLLNIVWIIAAIIAIPFILALFVKKEYAVERSVLVQKPQDTVFSYIKHLKNQDQYSVWATKDPHMKKTYRGTDGTIGFVSRWESNDKNVGVGEQEIKKITEGARVDFELRFEKPFQATEPAYMTTETAPDAATIVKWGFSGKMKYPLNIMLLFINMEKRIGNDLEAGLQQLKLNLEKE